MDNYLVVVSQRKTWRGWRRDNKTIAYMDCYARALILCNQLNNTDNRPADVRFIIIPIDKV